MMSHVHFIIVLSVVILSFIMLAVASSIVMLRCHYTGIRLFCVVLIIVKVYIIVIIVQKNDTQLNDTVYYRTAHNRHQCRKTTVLSCHGC
jgi:hypothetical protein